MRTISVAFGLACALLPLSALGQTGDLRLALVDEIRAVGCTLTNETANALPEKLGVPGDEMTTALVDLMLDGLLTVEDGNVVALPVALCNPAVAYTQTLTGPTDARVDEANAILVSAIVALFRLNACAMTNDQIDQALSPLGLTQAATNEAAQALVEAGGLQYDDATGLVQLSEALCSGSGDSVPSPRGQMVTLFAEAGNCRIVSDDAAEVMQRATGLPRSLSEAMVARMTDLGEIVQDRDAVELAAPLCTAGPAGSAPEHSQRTLEITRDNIIFDLNAAGCTMATFVTAEGLQTAITGDPEVIRMVIKSMVAAGEVMIADDLLTLSPGLCTAPAAAPVTAADADLDPREQIQRTILLTRMENNGCVLAAEDLASGIDGAGLTSDVVARIVADLLANGDAVLVDGAVTLPRDKCTP